MTSLYVFFSINSNLFQLFEFFNQAIFSDFIFTSKYLISSLKNILFILTLNMGNCFGTDYEKKVHNVNQKDGKTLEILNKVSKKLLELLVKAKTF